MKNLITILLILLVTNILSQNVISVDSTFQDPIERKAYIFEHLNLPDVLWDNGMTLVDFNQFDGVYHEDVVANSALFGLSYASVPMDSTEFVNQPHYANNQYLINLLDSLGLNSTTSNRSFNDDVLFRIPIKIWNYRDDDFKQKIISLKPKQVEKRTTTL